MQYLKSDIKYHGKYLDFAETSYMLKDGEVKIYESAVRKSKEPLNGHTIGHHETNAVVIVAFNADHSQILLNREFRLSVNDWVYNLPAGMIDEGEDTLSAARRELKEETGLDVIRVLRELPASFCSIGESNCTTKLVYVEAEGILHNDGNPIEEIEPLWVSKDKAREILQSDRITSRTQVLLDLWANGL